MEIDNNLVLAKEVLSKLCLKEDLYKRIYPFTTENINGYIDYFDLKNKSLLTVGSSGDQILNAYKNGCKDITLLDINPFSKYYINLKIASILSLNYQEFQKFFFKFIGNIVNNKRFNLEIFNKLSNNLKAIDYDSYYFFDKIFHEYDMNRICDYLMLDDLTHSKLIKEFNNYLHDEKSYNELKKNLKDISFKFIFENIFSFYSNLKFDNIFLSNICTITPLIVLRDLLINLKNNNLNNNGSIQLAYIWNTNFNDNAENFDLKEIYRMPATRTILKDFITEHHNIKGEYDTMFDKDSKSDLVLIYRK